MTNAGIIGLTWNCLPKIAEISISCNSYIITILRWDPLIKCFYWNEDEGLYQNLFFKCLAVTY